MIRVFNTLSNRLEEFEPLTLRQVTMYVCGPTVYDHAHIGHGRTYVVYDVIVRYLRYRGFSVRYARNITDIDDKIIRKAAQEGVSCEAIAARYTQSFDADMRDLGLVPPDAAPKASETVREIVDLVGRLVASGFAYEAKGDVYFSIVKDTHYGKLSKRDLSEVKAVARVEPGEHKKDPLDFALWKKAKPGEPFWPSPWGDGRPGWHIECSAMAKKLLGETIDIHAGGRDLIFPHHENEIAQSECANGKPFAKYWLHNGFLNLGAEKMSKSLGNIVTLRSLLTRYHPEALKLYLLTHHYRAPVDFLPTAVEESARGLDRIYRVLLSIPPPDGKVPRVETLVQKFEEAMDDDFNTARALAHLFDAVKDANRLQLKADTLPAAQALRQTIIGLGNVLGLLSDDPEQYFRKLPGAGDVDHVAIENLIASRAEARRKKDFKRADEIRNELTSIHRVVVEDSPEGTTWRVLT
ncbi:MAG: cysteine--tRNA ligase [Pseudomonadota bacterium]